jgi:hypothetical protein
MARQRQLERAGWTFVRVRASDFYAERETALRAITDACEELGIRPLDLVSETPLQSPLEEEPSEASAGRDSAGMGPLAAPRAEGLPPEAELSSADYGPLTEHPDGFLFPDPRDSSPANVRAVLRQIIEKDGPLTRSSVYQLYVEGCPGLQRVGRVVRQALNRALGTMLRSGEIVQEDEFHDGSPEGQVLRLAGTAMIQVRPAGRRDLLQIPPSELLAVLRRSFRGSMQWANDDESLLRAMLERYGFSRLTKPRREYLLKVLRLLRQPDQDARAASSEQDHEAG